MPASRERLARRRRPARGRASWRAETLTRHAQRRARRRRPAPRRPAAGLGSTARPSGTIRPVSSASGDERRPGASSPRSGCSQRPAPRRRRSRPVREVDDRLVVRARARPRRWRARSSAVQLEARRSRGVVHRRLEERVRAPLPRVLGARTSRRRRCAAASSASSRRASAPRRCRCWRRPTSSRPSTIERSAEAVEDPLGDRDRLALVGDVLEQDRELVAAQAGDACPRRARIAAAARRPSRSTASPAAWPSVSLTLEVVEVEEQHRDGAPPRRARASACSTRSRNSARFGEAGERVVERLVARARLERLRSLTSRVFRTMPSTALVADEVGRQRLDVDPAAVARRGRGTRRSPERPARGRRGTSCSPGWSSGWTNSHQSSAPVRPPASRPTSRSAAGLM